MKKYKKRWDKLDNYYRKQKIFGVIILLAALLSVVILHGDCTVALLLVLPGIYAVFTKDLVMYDDDLDELRELKRKRWMEP